MIESRGFKTKDLLHTLSLFPFFFILIYLDTIELPISSDLLWKLPFILIMFFLVIKDGQFKFPAFFVLGMLLAIKEILFYSEKPQYYFPAAGVAALDMIVPVITLFCIKNISYESIGKYIFVVSSWLILATIPYHLNLLTNFIAQTAGNDLTKFGDTGKIFTGPYASIHDAAITLSIASFCLLFCYKNSTKTIKFWIICMEAIGLYSVYATYVRTALVMIMMGLFILVFLNRKTTQLVSGVIVLFVIGAIFYVIYLNSTVLQLRFADTNVYDTQTAEGSGRVLFWTTMLTYITSGGVGLFLFGGGRENGRDYMFQAIGQRLFSHNGLIDILVSAGAIGLLIFILYQRQLFKRLKFSNRKILPSYKLVLTVFILYYTAIFFQGYQYFWIFMLMSFTIARLEKEYNYFVLPGKTSSFTKAQR